MDIFTRVSKFQLPLGQYAVFGSALLDIWGIRKALDLDIIATPELYQHLKNAGWKEKQGNGFTLLIKNDANVTTLQHEPTDGNYCPDRLQLIKDAVIINGIPFVQIAEVIACKRAYNRQKDRDDIAAIEAYLAKQRNQNLPNNKKPTEI